MCIYWCIHSILYKSAIARAYLQLSMNNIIDCANKIPSIFIVKLFQICRHHFPACNLIGNAIGKFWSTRNRWHPNYLFASTSGWVLGFPNYILWKYGPVCGKSLAARKTVPFRGSHGLDPQNTAILRPVCGPRNRAVLRQRLKSDLTHSQPTPHVRGSD